MKNSRLNVASLYAYYTISIIHLFEQVVRTGWINLTTKPMLVLILLVYFLSSQVYRSGIMSRLVIAALLFSWIGDVLLMLQGRIQELFIFGLMAFLAAHVCYIFAYRHARDKKPDKDYSAFIRGRSIFLVFVGLALIYMLYPGLEAMLVPVIVYTIVLIAMGISAVNRRGKTSDKSFIMVYSGALLFILSDAMIGIDKFLNPIFHARLLIMATYISAQFLIVKGIMLHQKHVIEPVD